MKAGIPRKTLAAGLAFLSTTLDFIGIPVIYKTKTRIKREIISRHNLNGQSILLSRYNYNKYDSNKIKNRRMSTKSYMPLNNQWQKGQYYFEEHDSSHLHHDFSLVVNGKVYRMARTPSENNKKLGYLGLFPGPKEKSAWKLQPEHYVNEVPNPKVIKEGYGKGTSKVIAKGNCYVRMSTGGNIEAVFDGFEGLFIFIEKDNDVLILRKHDDGPGIGKHQLKKGDIDLLDQYCDDPDYFFVKKYNGAAVDWKVVKGSDGEKYLKVWSWRPDKKSYNKYKIDCQINHTHRLYVCSKKLPSDFPLASGRAELWINKRDGLVKLNSILNSSIYNGIENNLEQPVLIVHDIITYEGINNVDQLSYAEKINIIQELNRRDKRFNIPEFAYSNKKEFWLKTKDQGTPFDGVIIWNHNDPDSPGIKMKFKNDESSFHNGFIVDFIAQTGEHGDKYVFPIVENEAGARFTISGRGMTNQLKADMKANPEKYLNAQIIYGAEHHFDKTGKPFQPIFIRFDDDIECISDDNISS